MLSTGGQMKLFFRILFAILPLSTTAQLQRGETFLTPDSLARQLTATYTNDKDKVAAIFNWITDNISYNVRPWRDRNKATGHVMDDPSDTCALKPLSERVAIDVLNRRIAFCDGYSRLFKTLCDYAGIRSEVITGYAAVNGRSRTRFSSNHRWNAVFLDSTWQLLDATWASGYISFGDEFERRYNSYYYLTPPKDFIRDHYPEELQWTLLPEPPVLSEFRHSPFKTNAFVKNKISSYKPESGLIDASEGDTLHFEIVSVDEDKKLVIIDTPYIDSAVIAAALSDSLRPKAIINGNTIAFTYIVTSPAVEWLNVVFNDEITLRYKLNVKKKETVAK